MDARFSNFSIDRILAHSENMVPNACQQPQPEHYASRASSPAGAPHLYRPSPQVGLAVMRRYGIPVALQINSPTFSFCCDRFYSMPSSLHYSNVGIGHPDPCSYETAFQTEQMCCPNALNQRHRSRLRTVFTDSQTKQLDHLFSLTAYPSVEARAELARNIGLNEETVRVWFKNRRARRKRQCTKAKSPEYHREDHREETYRPLEGTRGSHRANHHEGTRQILEENFRSHHEDHRGGTHPVHDGTHGVQTTHFL